MKVILVYPKDIAENYFAKRPVMGIAYVGTMLEKAGHEVRLLDMRIKGYTNKFFKKQVEDFKPDLVGFSMVALSMDQAYELMTMVKEITPNAIIVCGGPEVSLLPKKILGKENVDFVISGEGEYSFVELIDCLNNNKDYTSIYGLGYKNEGELFHRPAKSINNLDKLPFPNYDLFNLKDYRKDISKIKWPIMTSRGCPYSCRFCDSTRINPGYRVRTAKNVADEMQQLKEKYNASQYQILDDNFAIYKQRAIYICQELIDRKLNIKWVIGQGFSPSKGDPLLFKKMYEAGCRVVYFGVESADDEVLRAIGKPHTVAQVRNATKWAKDAGLIVKAPFISGLPKSTYEKEKKYIQFFKEIGIDMPKMGQLIPFPGTPMYGWVKKNATRMFMGLDDMHEKASQSRGALDTKLFKVAFETADFPVEQRIKILKEFQRESEMWILQNTFSKPIGWLMYWASRWRPIRKLGVRFLDIYYTQF